MIIASKQHTKLLVKKRSIFILFVFFQQCVASNDGNIIVSPYSVAVALALAAQGAKGSTLQQLVKGLHLSGDKQAVAEQFALSAESLSKNLGNSTLSIANKVFVQDGYTVKKEFGDVAVKSFRSEAQSINFAKSVEAAGTINHWVEDKTNNKIKDLIPASALDSLTRLVLVNAIYFKGNWEHQFDKARTAPGPFHNSLTTTVQVDYMHIKEHFNFGYLQDLDAQAIELKYAQSDISFLVVLPNKRDGLSALENKLKDLNDLSVLTKEMYSQEVDVTLPKFKIEFKIELKEALEKVGFCRVFFFYKLAGARLEGGEELGKSLIFRVVNNILAMWCKWLSDENT